MRLCARLSRNTRLSTGPGAWVLTWIMLSPAIALWLAVKLVIAIGKAIPWLVRQIDPAPAVAPVMRRDSGLWHGGASPGPGPGRT
jgi:hypothetical protein